MTYGRTIVTKVSSPNFSAHISCGTGSCSSSSMRKRSLRLRSMLSTMNAVTGKSVVPWRGNMTWAGRNLIFRRSEEHTSELQSLMRISYAVFCLKKKKINYSDKIYTIDINTDTSYDICTDNYLIQ